MDQLTKKTKAELLKMAEAAKLKVDGSMKKDMLSAKLLLSSITDRTSYKFADLKKADLELLCKAEGMNVRGKNKQDLVDRLCRGVSPEPLPDLPKDVIGTIIENIKDVDEARRIASILKDTYSIRRIEEADKTIEKFEVWYTRQHKFEVHRKDYPSKEAFEYNMAAILQLFIYGSWKSSRTVEVYLTDQHGQQLKIEVLRDGNIEVSVNDRLVADLLLNIWGYSIKNRAIRLMNQDADRLRLLRWLKLINFKENKEKVNLSAQYRTREVEQVMKQVRKEIQKEGPLLQTEVDKLFKNGIVFPKSVEQKLKNQGADFSFYDLNSNTPLMFVFTKQNNAYIPKDYPKILKD